MLNSFSVISVKLVILEFWTFTVGGRIILWGFIFRWSYFYFYSNSIIAWNFGLSSLVSVCTIVEAEKRWVLIFLNHHLWKLVHHCPSGIVSGWFYSLTLPPPKKKGTCLKFSNYKFNWKKGKKWSMVHRYNIKMYPLKLAIYYACIRRIMGLLFDGYIGQIRGYILCVVWLRA